MTTNAWNDVCYKYIYQPLVGIPHTLSGLRYTKIFL